MSSAAIECRGLSKRYVLAHRERYSALRDRLSPGYWLARMRGQLPQSTNEEFWALDDVSFDVKPGEAVGIIGRNGAGKSTLLKVLSRVVHPTSGYAKISGRVASLLEVGTGFHPELSGRENIYLNGAILGMKRGDIARKFDAIIDFSGVEKFLDTPVKHYSSGMYVRLAFAVAAHLEPEILIIDEVLAVGDAEFQRKCLGKMEDVARTDGRTILFVSHNMTAVQSLCRRAIWLNGGKVTDEGDAPRVVARYLQRHGTQELEKAWPAGKGPGGERGRIQGVRVVPGGDEPSNVDTRTPLRVEVDFWNEVEDARVNVTVHLNALSGECIFAVGGGHGPKGRGAHRIACEIPGDFLNDGTYTITPLLVLDSSTVLAEARDAVTVQVNDAPRESGWLDKWPGAVRPNFFRWTTERIDVVKANGVEAKPHAEAETRA